MRDKIKIPPSANELILRLEQNGFSAYAVGGCVRDSLMGRTPNDWDICTDALPETTEKLFASDKRVIPTGIKHGTVTVINDGEAFEITTFRVDGKYTDNRRPDSVTFTPSLEEDLRRRDFTVNAIAYNEREGIKDPCGGLADIQNGVLRCVGNPAERFDEDALRILRCIRFACRTGFEIESDTKAAVHDRCGLLKNIAAERINDELLKMLGSELFYKKLAEFKDVFFVFMPELEKTDGFLQNNPYHVYDVFTHTVKALENCSSRESTVRLAVLLHDIGKPLTAADDENGIRHFYGHAEESEKIAKKLLTELKFDGCTKKDVCELVKYHDIPLSDDRHVLKRRLNKQGEKQLLRLLEVKKADVSAQNPALFAERMCELEKISDTLKDILSRDACFSVKALAVNGDDLIEIGYIGGKFLGDTLKYLLECVVSEKAPNEKEALSALAKRRLEEIKGGGFDKIEK